MSRPGNEIVLAAQPHGQRMTDESRCARDQNSHALKCKAVFGGSKRCIDAYRLDQTVRLI